MKKFILLTLILIPNLILSNNIDDQSDLPYDSDNQAENISTFIRSQARIINLISQIRGIIEELDESDSRTCEPENLYNSR